MAITEILLSGKLFQDDGDVVNGATVALLETGTSTQEASTTTDSNGAWSFTETSLDATYDVKITSGTSVRYILWSDEITTKGVDTASLKVRGVEGAVAPIYFFADQADDAGDGWRMQASASDTLAIGSDKASAGTIIDYLTITNGANAAASTVTVGGILTVTTTLDVNGTADFDVTDFDIASSGDIDLVSTNDAAAAIYLRENAGTSGTIKIHADQGTSVTEGAESINILSDAGGVGIRSTANLANALNLTVDGGTTSSMTLFNDTGTTATEGSASIQLLSDVGGINVKSGLNGANAILLTADGGTSETIVLHADQGTGTGSIELLSDAGGIELDAGTDIILDAGGADIFLKDDGTLFGTLNNNSGELLIKSSSSGTTAATFTGANVVFAGTVDATTDFTIGDTVVTDGVITDSSGLQLVANLDIDGTADISGDLTLSGGADGALQFTNAGENSIKIPDNQASALIIEEANNAYITFVTTDSSEAITVAKATTFSAGIANAGTIAAGTWNGTAIASGYIAGDAITGAKIADDAIDSEHYTDGSIDNAHIADDAIDSEHYAAASIDFAHIQNVAANSVLGRNANSSGVLSEVALATTQLLIGDGTGFTAAALSGDATMTNAGVVSLAAAQTNVTSLLATDIKIGEDSQTLIDFETANEIHFDADNAERVKIDSTGLNIVSGSLETATIDYTDGDLAITIADGGGITAAAGITSTAAANTFGNTSFNDGNITNVGSIDLDTITADGTDIAITSDAGGNIILGDGDTLIDVDGGLRSGHLGFLGVANSNNAIYIAPAATTSGAGASWNWMQLGGGSGVTVPSGTSSHVATLNLEEPNITATGTVTVATTLRIVSAPSEGSSNYAMWVDAGTSRFDGNVDLNATGTLLKVGATNNQWTATELTINNDTSGGGDIVSQVRNSEANTGANAVFKCFVGSTSGGDPKTLYQISGGANWHVGVDNSVDDQFTIGPSTDPAGDDAVRITTAKAISFDDANASYTTFSSDYVCDGCGKAAIEMFECCGVVAWHDDVLALRELQLSPEGLKHMAKLGIYEIDGPDGAQPGATFINYQKATKYTWAGMYQNRQRMDAQYERLDERLARIEAAIGA